MPKSTPMTMDAILDARFMVQPPHQNFGPNLDLLGTGQQHCTSGGVALRRLETALRGGDSVHILLPNKALRALRHFWIPWWSQGGSILPSVYTTPSAAGNAIHPHHFVIVLCQSEYPRLRGFQCLVKPSPQNR